MSKTVNLAKLHLCAWEFSKDPTRTADRLSEIMTEHQLPIAPRTIIGWENLPDWTKALRAYGHTGDTAIPRHKKRDVHRDAGDAVSRAKQLFNELINDGTTASKAITKTAETLNLPRQRVYRWHRRGLLKS